MKIVDVPQDLKYYKDSIVRDVNYAVDDNGLYEAVISDGWQAKTDALDAVWNKINNECEVILDKVKKGETSLLEYYATKNLMTIELLSSYTGFSKRKIRKHFDPKNFDKLDYKTLQIYADTLRITVEKLTSMPV